MSCNDICMYASRDSVTRALYLPSHSSRPQSDVDVDAARRKLEAHERAQTDLRASLDETRAQQQRDIKRRLDERRLRAGGGFVPVTGRPSSAQSLARPASAGPAPRVVRPVSAPARRANPTPSNTAAPPVAIALAPPAPSVQPVRLAPLAGAPVPLLAAPVPRIGASRTVVRPRSGTAVRAPRSEGASDSEGAGTPGRHSPAGSAFAARPVRGLALPPVSRTGGRAVLSPSLGDSSVRSSPALVSDAEEDVAAYVAARGSTV